MSMENNHYSDLQVVPSADQPKFFLSGPEKHSEVLGRVPSDKTAVQTHVYEDTEEASPRHRNGTAISRLPRRTLWIIIAVVVVVVVGAVVGGGLGGTLSKKAASESFTSAIASSSPISATLTSAINVQSSPTSPTSTLQSSTATLTTTEVVGPSGTLLSDCPSSNDTGYSPPSSTQMFRKICGESLMNANSFEASVTEQVSTLDDCISACASFNLRYAAEIAVGTKSICNAACWRATGGDYSGWCYGYTTQNSTGSFTYGGDTRCNSAALINQ